MIRRWLSGRNARKFFRHRMAVVALGVIGLYLMVAILVGIFGVITLDQSEQRVGMRNVPGLFRQQTPEKRLEDCYSYLEGVERALGRENPRAALNEIRYGSVKVADLSIRDTRATVERGMEIVEQLDQSENLNEAPEYLPDLARLEAVVAELFPEPDGLPGLARKLEMLLGTDRQGRSIFLRVVYSINVALKIGFITALIAVTIGSLLGTAAAFFGSWVDHVVIWLFTTFSSIPNLVLLVLLAYMFTGSRLDGTLIPVYIAFSATFWIGPCRVMRGETLKLKELEYVQAATAIGFSRFYILLRHVIPNAAHLMLINFSLLFIGAIKSEVILTYLGLGVKEGPSWGIMISQSAAEVNNGFFWQIGTTTVLMFGLVLAFNILSDALQDVFDPKHL